MPIGALNIAPTQTQASVYQHGVSTIYGTNPNQGYWVSNTTTAVGASTVLYPVSNGYISQGSLPTPTGHVTYMTFVGADGAKTMVWVDTAYIDIVDMMSEIHSNNMKKHKTSKELSLDDIAWAEDEIEKLLAARKKEKTEGVA